MSLSSEMKRKVTFSLDYFNAIATCIQEGRESAMFSIESNSPDHLKTKISIYFHEGLNYHLKDSCFPYWMGEAPRANSPWTEEEEKLVIQQYKYGYTIKQLADMTGRKETGVLSRLEQKFPELKQVREATQEMKNIEKELNCLIERANKAKNLIHYKP